jgi:hypothetical protein
VPWTASNASYVTVAGNALKLSPFTSGTSCWTWAYATPSGAPISLNVGDSVRLSFKYTYNLDLGGVANLFRVGLFSTGAAARQLTDGNSFNPTTLKGYAVQTNSQAVSSTGSAVYAENNNNLAGMPFNTAGGGTYAKVGTDFDSVDAKATTHTAQIIVTRNAGSVDVSVDLDTAGTGGKAVRTDTTLNLTSFDAIAFFHQSVGDNTRWVLIDDVLLDYLPAVTTTVVVNETFADGTRANQTPALGSTPYTSLPWVASHADLTTVASGGVSMSLATGFARQIWSYFTAQNAPVALAAGETIQLSFDYKYSVDGPTQGSMLRFGLFNGGASPRSLTDGTAAAPVRLAQDSLKGYEFEIDAQANTTKGVTAKREINSVTDNLAFFGTLASLEPQYTSADATTVKRSAVMTIKNHGWKTDLTLNLDATNPLSTTMTFADVSADRITGFDMVAFSNYYPTANTVTFSNIAIKRVSGTATPEPYPTVGGEGARSLRSLPWRIPVSARSAKRSPRPCRARSSSRWAATSCCFRSSWWAGPS